MKLETTLPERAGFLHAVPIFDLFGLLLVFFLLGPSFVKQSGIEVELPLSRFQVERHADASVVTLSQPESAGGPAVIWLERRQVTESELGEELTKRREELPGDPVLYVRTDGAVPAVLERRIAELAIVRGYRVYLLGRSTEPELR